MNRKTFNSACRKQTKPSGLWGAPPFPIGTSEVEIHQDSLLPGTPGLGKFVRREDGEQWARWKEGKVRSSRRMERSPRIQSARQTSQNTHLPGGKDTSRQESGIRGRRWGLQGRREILQVGLKGPARPSIGVLCGCQTFTCGGLTHRFEKPGNREAFNLDPTNGAKEALGVPHKYILILKTKDKLVAILRGDHIPPRAGKQICKGQRLDKRQEPWK